MLPMVRADMHAPCDFFEFVIATDSAPAADDSCIDIALLDMHHGWPNVGHDSLAHAVLEIASESRETLVANQAKIRVISYDVRRRNLLPESGARFALYVGSGGPGHLDPRKNDGVAEHAQGIREASDWEAPLFQLFDAIFARPDAAFLAVCHSFGLMCRWSGVAQPVLRDEKSSGIPLNTLTESAARHPWFSRFAEELPDHRHFRVVDNRLFDLIVADTIGAECLAFENENSAALTMVELARDPDGIMPRILGMNHHPEIIDRDHVMNVLAEKKRKDEVTEAWFEERAETMRDLFHGETERQSRLTSEYTLIGPLRHHVRRIVAERCEVDGSSLPQTVQRAIQ